MTKWNRTAIEVMARGEGWGARSKDASYVAMAESGGDDKVVNSIGCVGLMQINQPVHRAAHPTWTVKWLQDPTNNLKAALVLYKAAGNKFDGPWLDSRDKGGGGGWGQHVKGSGGGGLRQVDSPEEACKHLNGPAREACIQGERERQEGGGGGGPLDALDDLGEVADQIGRLAQAMAKAGNWLGSPANWLRIVYVAGGGLLGLAAVAVIVRPYSMNAYRQVSAVLPTKTAKRAVRAVRGQETP